MYSHFESCFAVPKLLGNSRRGLVLVLFTVVLCCTMVESFSTLRLSQIKHKKQYTDNEKFVCSKNMPCQWAVCPWTVRPLYYEREIFDDCDMVVNSACSCPDSTVCRLSTRAEHTFFTSRIEYLCM
ncbi:uncharacterized protein LOC141909024 [Tubulanus polymorphus]|uniref:uncharacterized protein LOC141909024 n=1 Tax=Tubulanus polymorphus TaxID=672921 RepID=UPI003DA29F74